MCLEEVIDNVQPEALTNICDAVSKFIYPMQLIQITPFKLLINAIVMVSVIKGFAINHKISHLVEESWSTAITSSSDVSLVPKSLTLTPHTTSKQTAEVSVLMNNAGLM